MFLVHVDDRLFVRLVRQDLRREVWRRGFTTKDNGSTDERFLLELDAVQRAGIDYDMTVKLYRRKRRRGNKKDGSLPKHLLTDNPGEPESTQQYVMSPASRGVLRQLWAGGLLTGERLHAAKVSSLCPFCLMDTETCEHLLWR